MNPTTIDWPGLTHTLNPVSGCLRGCTLDTRGFNCYACTSHTIRHKATLKGKKLPERYKYSFNEIHYWPDTFDTVPKNPKKPIKIFIGSMSDICYWKPSFLQKTVDFCESRPNIEFMFLTKGPLVYERICTWPANCMLGLTITRPADLQHFSIERFYNILHSRKFLSIEPLLGSFNYMKFRDIDLVIVGADSTKGAAAPKKEWIDSIKHDNIHWKANIKKYL